MNRLRELRTAMHFTQKEMAIELDVTVKTYRSWEKTDNPYPTISAENLVKLSEIFSYSIDYILGLSDYTSDYNNLVGEKTGLTNDAIETLKILNNPCEPNALHTLNLLLANTDKAIALLSNIRLIISNDDWKPCIARNLEDDPDQAAVCPIYDSEYLAFCRESGKPSDGVLLIDDSILKSHAIIKIQELLNDIKGSD